MQHEAFIFAPTERVGILALGIGGKSQVEVRLLLKIFHGALELVKETESMIRPSHLFGQVIDPGNHAPNLVRHRAKDAFPGLDR